MSALIDTHPHIGRAHKVAKAIERHEANVIRDEYPDDEKFCEVLRHDFSIGKCCICGAREFRYFFTSRLLIGCNTRTIVSTWKYDRDCNHGNGMSTYRQPWPDD